MISDINFHGAGFCPDETNSILVMDPDSVELTAASVDSVPVNISRKASIAHMRIVLDIYQLSYRPSERHVGQTDTHDGKHTHVNKRYQQAEGFIAWE